MCLDKRHERTVLQIIYSNMLKRNNNASFLLLRKQHIYQPDAGGKTRIPFNTDNPGDINDIHITPTRSWSCKQLENIRSF